MIKKLPLLFVLLLGMLKTQAQDSVQYRMILIGDAGEIDMQQSAVLKHAAANVLKNKTSVFYLGDNIYPRGMGLPGSPEEAQTQKILQSQYQPMRTAGAPVYFLPGNHDWDKMGPLGLAKIKRQWAYLDQQGDKLLKMVPENGCPDPVEINLTNELTVIAFDSEWWLYPFNKSNPGAECDCKNKDDIADKIKLIFERNKDKVIILASHHPFQSYGTHGGYFSLKDHIFPLTVVNKDLWVPLPVIGSLYPFLRSTFSNPEDLGHPLYKEMIRKVDAVFGSFPNLIHVAGHEHGLQFIKSKQVQVVSGAGAKQTYAIKGRYSLFADATQGYVIADLLIDKRMRFTYYIDSEQGVKQVFAYTQPYTSVKNVPDTLHTPIKADSIMVRVHPKYDSVSNFHRRWFGENYRKEWAAETKLPVIRLSEIHGGLKAESIGGGFQTHSLRLIDKDGKEWVLRSVEKQPEKILPDEFQETFAKDWVNDAMSAQHPFSALIVPPLATAARVPHANPIIGVVSPDPVLGQYAHIFANKVCLLEEREPGGKSDNTVKMIGKMLEDNDNTVDGEEFLRARLLDLLIGDWDRHGDQWRWRDEDKGKGKFYTAVPRDRDQVFYTNQGVLPTIAAQPWIAPNLQGFSGEIYSVKYSLWKTMFMQRWPSVQYSHEQWTKIVDDFVAAETDEVLEAGLRRLPESSYKLRHDVLLKQLKERRANIPAEMEYYYKFINKIVDIHASNKNELVTVKDEPNGSLNVVINKINKNGEVKDTLMNQSYHPDITKELRIYVGGGDDKVVLDNATSPIKLRFIDSTGTKTYNIVKSRNTVQLYDRGKKLNITGDESSVNKHISKDSANTSFLRVNLMNVIAPLANISYNPDEGVLLGAGFKYTHQEGFQKLPYNDVQTVFASHSFSTKAFKFSYSGEWIHAFGKADYLMNVQFDYPDNINFFGRGNETPFIKIGDYRKYHRTRFTNLTFSPAFRWRNESGTSVTVGPAFQYYKLNIDDNTGRFITYPLLTNAPDSYTFDKTKIHAGVVVNFINDKRNDKVLPAWGSFINIKLQEFNGLNNNSTSFAQLIPQVALYKSLNAKSTIVLADRVGGGITIGKTAFYQSLFLGGQDNLLGYRLYRFAGQHSFYNNLELRIKLSDFASYIVPGQIGVIGFYDIGRVWENGQSSDKWHNGTGAGFYVAPARLAVIKVVAAYSEEGWYPYLSTSFRF
ncbi:Calcineurin-like phosphoesterase [Mucilaginibacter gossypiicola]|uniref:Calcineurin-like phosphoesterase n=1 Tax=Mucilaginibacter gossypiicola TaxID=551995 RepID=A0A1H8KLG7_9SPHI|nr:BamA/TamA family outer membrane protein [Mucilaginibacter gossypiicola]SEN93799.1 Calcineurin-like phosphoesterase [Mucilaginibacter gossypiicola]